MKKKLAIVATHPIQYYAPVFKMLAERGTDIKVFYTWGDDSIDKHDPGFGKKIAWDIPLLEGYEYEFFKNISKNPGSHHFFGIDTPDAITKLSSYAPNAILVCGWANKSHLKIIRHFKGKIPVWFRGDSNLLDGQFGLKNILRWAFLKWIYSHVDKAFYVGTANKKYFEKYGLKEHQLVFAPHAVDNERFSEDRAADAIALREAHNMDINDILILFAGKLEQKKNPDILFQAFVQLNLNHVHLIFVGNGEAEQRLKSMAGKLVDDVNTRLHFIDFQNQSIMPVVYQACNIFCLPSQGPGETWGLAVNEAMAARKAILVSDKVGCANDLVKQGQNGYIFESENIQSLKSSLSKLCASSSNLEDMGKISSEMIKSWSFSEQTSIFMLELNKI